jgi:hypothetical protein
MNENLDNFASPAKTEEIHTVPAAYYLPSFYRKIYMY